MLSVQDIGIDLGTVNTLVYVTGRGIVVNEPSVLAINEATGDIVAAGRYAQKMTGKSPEFIEPIQPLVNGVIADYEVAELMLKYYLSQASIGGFGRLLKRSKVLVAVPAYLSEVEVSSIKDAIHGTTASDAILLPESMAAAIGGGVSALDTAGTMIVDMGGGTTEIAIICSGGIVAAESLIESGNTFNKALIDFVGKEFNLAIGDLTAEHIKRDLGAARLGYSKLEQRSISGKDITSGTPRSVTMTSEAAVTALEKPISMISKTVGRMLEEAEPDMVSDILSKGVVLSGGNSLLPGLPEFLQNNLEVRFFRTEDPLTDVARGTGVVLEDLGAHRKLLDYSNLKVGA